MTANENETLLDAFFVSRALSPAATSFY